MGEARTKDGLKAGGLYSPHPRSRFAYYVAGWSAIFDVDENALRRQLHTAFWHDAADRFRATLVRFGLTVEPTSATFVESVIQWTGAEWRLARPRLDHLSTHFAGQSRRPHKAIIRYFCERHRSTNPNANDNAVCAGVAKWLNAGIPEKDAGAWSLDDDHVRRGWYGISDRANVNRICIPLEYLRMGSRSRPSNPTSVKSSSCLHRTSRTARPLRPP